MLTEELTYLQAINRALHRAMRESEDVIVFGEDVAKPGGVFGATKGLFDQFGAGRVFDTPISEAAILGAAIGSATHGLRPIAEIMWIDFSLVAADQLINQAANVRFVSCAQQTAPLVVRTQQGRTPGSCAQHSQCLEAIYAHIPGLRICIPSTPADAYAGLLSAVECDDPVLFIEHRSMYASAKSAVQVDGPVAPIGGARIVRTGSDVTVVTYGTMVSVAEAAAANLSDEGFETEIVDLRWLNPLDFNCVASSISKTGRLAILHEANVTGGFGAEIAARAASDCLFDLDAPVIRIGLPDVRMPAAPHLQSTLLPSVDSVTSELRSLIQR